MRFFYLAILLLNLAIMVMNISRGSSMWWVSLFGAAVMAFMLYSNAQHRKRMARLRDENDRFHAEHEARMARIMGGDYR